MFTQLIQKDSNAEPLQFISKYSFIHSDLASK